MVQLLKLSTSLRRSYGILILFPRCIDVQVAEDLPRPVRGGRERQGNGGRRVMSSKSMQNFVNAALRRARKSNFPLDKNVSAAFFSVAVIGTREHTEWKNDGNSLPISRIQSIFPPVYICRKDLQQSR